MAPITMRWFAAERLLAVEGLGARGKVDDGIVVLDGDGKRDLDAADGVDDGDELLEVDLGVVRDVDARKARDHVDHVGRAAVGVGGVDLLLPVRAHVDHRVTRDRDERDLLRGRVHACEDDGVRTEVRGVRPPLLRPALALVDAEQQHVEGLLRLNGHELLTELRGDPLVEAAVDVREVEPERAARAGEKDEDGDEEGLEDPAAALAALAALVGVDAVGARRRASRRVAGGGGAAACAAGLHDGLELRCAPVEAVRETRLLRAGHALVLFPVGHEGPFCRWGATEPRERLIYNLGIIREPNVRRMKAHKIVRILTKMQ